jgi:hypothetical protein
MEAKEDGDVVVQVQEEGQATDLTAQAERKRKRSANRRLKNDKKPKTNLELTDLMLENLPYKCPGFSMDDARALTADLGYLPYNVIKVAARDGSGKPIVAYLYGLTREKTCNGVSTKPLHPFPTVYWLTCPTLKSNISKLEDDGWITKLQDRLAGDPAFIEQMQRAHELYAEERRDTLSEEDLAFLAGNKSLGQYHLNGIAGMQNTNFKSVKCLHTHYAHYMGNPAHDNCIGKWVSELLRSEGYL